MPLKLPFSCEQMQIFNSKLQRIYNTRAASRSATRFQINGREVIHAWQSASKLLRSLILFEYNRRIGGKHERALPRPRHFPWDARLVSGCTDAIKRGDVLALMWPGARLSVWKNVHCCVCLYTLLTITAVCNGYGRG